VTHLNILNFVNEQHKPFLERAIDLAENNARDSGGGPFGAIIVRNGNVVGEGVNRVTSKLDPTAHAEIEAIRKACQALGTFALDDCAMYSSCEPCTMCLSAILWSRIQEVYYASAHTEANKAGFDDSRIRNAVSEYLKDQVVQRDLGTVPVRQLDLDAAHRPFDSWRRNPDKINY